MKNGDDTLWTIDELGGRVASALAAGYGGVASGRVRDIPDLRTIRYYTTLGLLDRPAEMRGRTALYGQRHLRQLLAIKRLQAKGLSLAEVQERVVGLSNKALGRLAEADPPAREGEREGAMPSSRPGSSAEGGGRSSRQESFWRVGSAEGEGEAPEGALAEPRGAAWPTDPYESRVQTSIPLADGLVLSLAAGRMLGDDDVDVIRMAAAPLIEILKLRGLIGPAKR